MKVSKDDAAEVALAAALDVLAAILVPLGITPSRLAQIARASFIKVSARSSRMRTSGRPHLARIAAQTGLSRAEVKRIVASNFSYGRLEPENLPRAARVLSAWKTSPTFSSRGKPRRLKIVGALNSFEALCRQFSGDIPYKVILTELQRSNDVKLTLGGTHVAVSQKRLGTINQVRELANLVFAASLIEQMADGKQLLVKRKENVSAPAEIPRQYFQNAIAGRVTDLLDNLPELFAGSKKINHKNSHKVTVYTVVAVNRRAEKTPR